MVFGGRTNQARFTGASNSCPGRVWRYAAGFAGSAAIYPLAYCYLERSDERISMKNASRIGLALVFMDAALGAQSNSTPPALYFSASELARLQAGLAVTSDADGTTSSKFLNPESSPYDLRLFRRTRGGSPALHIDRTYIFLVRGGAASMHVGGELVNPTRNGADVTGTAIHGGQVLKVGPGDMITIPPKVPHAWLIGNGQFVEYSLLRIQQNTGAQPR